MTVNNSKNWPQSCFSPIHIIQKTVHTWSTKFVLFLTNTAKTVPVGPISCAFYYKSNAKLVSAGSTHLFFSTQTGVHVAHAVGCVPYKKQKMLPAGPTTFVVVSYEKWFFLIIKHSNHHQKCAPRGPQRVVFTQNWAPRHLIFTNHNPKNGSADSTKLFFPLQDHNQQWAPWGQQRLVFT